MSNLKESRRSFNQWAKSYDSGILLPIYFSRVQRKIKKLLGDVREKKVLDIGCGTGNFLISIYNPEAEMVGIDLSEEMIEIARNKSKGMEGLEFKIGEAGKVNGGDFDYIVSTFSFHHWPEQENALKRVYEALKPEGKFIMSDVNFFGGPGTNRIVRFREMKKMLLDAGFSEAKHISATDSGKFGFISAVAGLPVAAYGLAECSLASCSVATAMIAGGIIYSIPNWMSKIVIGVK